MQINRRFYLLLRVLRLLLRPLLLDALLGGLRDLLLLLDRRLLCMWATHMTSHRQYMMQQAQQTGMQRQEALALVRPELVIKCAQVQYVCVAHNFQHTDRWGIDC